MIQRVPIKIRKPIHREFCNCHGVQVFAIEGIPHLINADKLSYLEFKSFLDSTHYSVPIYLSQPLDECMNKASLTLNYGLPVTIRTNQAIPLPLLEKMREVPHSAIHVSINFLDDLLRERLEKGSDSVETLRENLSLAKSWKIFVALQVDYQPHLTRKLDLYEIIDITKNYISHILLRFPDVPDDYLQKVKTQWESLIPSSLEVFKKVYTPDVPNRVWKAKERYVKEFVSNLQDFIKAKKLTVELLGEHTEANRVRHIPSGLSGLPLGIKPFTFAKVEGKFVEAPIMEEPCPTCGNTLFL